MSGVLAGAPAALLPALLAALAVVVLAGPRRGPAPRRLRAIGPLVSSPPDRPAGLGRGGGAARGYSAVRWVAAFAGVVTAVLQGGLLGVLLGAGVALLLPRVLARFEPRRERERRERLRAQAADVADLLAACLASGAPVPAAVAAVATAVGAPAGPVLQTWVAAVALGAEPAQAWSAVAADPPLAPIAVAAARSAETGAPLSDLLPGVAADLRRRARSRAENAARAAGVAAVAPLAACFLPAFLLLGVVPVVAALAGQLLTG